MRHAGLERLDFALSRVALGKDDASDVATRTAALQRLVMGRAELGVVVTDAQLIVDVARGYDVVVMGADKWAQVNDPSWYASADARDAGARFAAEGARGAPPWTRGIRRRDPRDRRTARRGVLDRRPGGRRSLDRPARPCEPETTASASDRRRDERDRLAPERVVAGPRGRVATAAARIATARAIGPGSDRGGVRRPPAPRLPRRRARRAYSSPTRAGADATPPTTASWRKLRRTPIRRRSS